ncbi:hypothetical protein BC834DRAFT_971471 [Gloeopeniophorella convolvens]|nr:hypothetical protein BC834DRAFT_971471 [Gloeopeniophorella convolvens]
MTDAPPVHPNLSEVNAPRFLGLLWNWMLYGILSVQIYIYSYNFRTDRRVIKLLVYGIFLLETLQTALTGADLYYWFASGFGNMEHFGRSHAAPYDVPVIGAFISMAVQLFYPYRIWVLERRCWWICALICIGSMVDSVGSLVGGVKVAIRGKATKGRALQGDALISVVGEVVTDALIAVTMIYLLTRHKGSSSRLNKHALSRIIQLTIETSLITTSVAVVSLLMVFLFPDKAYFTCPMAVLGKLYSNSLLVSLNNRISLREAPLESGSTSIAIDISKATAGRKSGRSSLSRKTDVAHKGGLSEA